MYKFEWSNQNVYHLMLARREYQQDRDWAGENFKIKIPLKQNKWFLKSAKTVYRISLFYKKKYCENSNKFHTATWEIV